MSKYPLRDLTRYGVITDVAPFDLPVGAWSMGVNCTFTDGHVSRGPIFRSGQALAGANPRHVRSFEDTATGFDKNYVGYTDGTIGQIAGTTETDVSITAYTPTTNEGLWTSCVLGSVLYFNRPDRVPWAFTPGASRFANLAVWDSTWRANIIRTYNGALFALGVTKGSTFYPNMIKGSDILPDNGVVPTTWTPGPTVNAYENQLVEMQSGIVDAAVLGQALIVYGKNEAWLVQANGSRSIYACRKLPFSSGAINVNCAIEVDNKHFVFGPDDIWVHDGISHKSISDGRIRKFVYKTMSSSQASRCFVTHNPNLKKIYFCYFSGDAFVKWTNKGCNRAAVYDYINDRWDGFLDLPLVFSATMANASVSVTWTTVTGTWDTIGGSWGDYGAGFKRAPFFVGEASSPLSSMLYALDIYGTGSLIAKPVNVTASPTMILERDGLDLDEVVPELSGYKHIFAVYPEATLDVGAAPLEFQFGGADYFTNTPTFSDWMTYGDADEHYHLDFTDGGRYLSMKIRFQDYKNVQLSGMDLDLDSYGNL